MNLKHAWIWLLCICLALMLFGNLIAQEQTRRPRRGQPGWKGPPIGSVVDDFELPLLDGGTFKLSDQRGKIIIVEMGACT